MIVNNNEADPEKGFYWPYYILEPAEYSSSLIRLIVEPNNTGKASSEQTLHDQKVRQLMQYPHIQSFLHNLQMPILIPVFPRESHVYTHALTRKAMEMKYGSMRRMDLQLIAMVKDAVEKLMKKGLKVESKILLNGYSASSKFVTRFTLMHPELIQAVTAGGVNGILTFPITQLKGETLRYPIGVADLSDIILKTFDFKTFSKVPHFIYMGMKDSFDSVPYPDSYDEQDKEQIYRLISEKMLPDRWNNTQSVMDELGCSFHFKTYEDVGHCYSPEIISDLIGFFKQHLN